MTDPSAYRWQLPDGVDELLPDDAWRYERLRQRITDCCRSWGYALVVPPVLEFVDSLLTGTGEDMDVQTFKLIDQHNGRTLGIRADMTPQVARMDAHSLRREAPNRLFYTGTVLHARSDGLGSSRSPQQFGAELFGHAGPESDVEIILLMIESVRLAGIDERDLMLDLGHVGLFRRLVDTDALDATVAIELRRAFMRGSRPDVERVLSTTTMSDAARRRVVGLLDLRGDQSVLARARATLAADDRTLEPALDTLRTVADAVRRRHPALDIHFDLAELRGYRYHTGMLFALHSRAGAELARGGRYDDVGAAFGRARPATGFSGDLKQLVATVPGAREFTGGIYFDPWTTADDMPDPWPTVVELRRQGERVVSALPGVCGSPGSFDCDRELRYRGGRWTVVPLSVTDGNPSF